MRSNCKDYNHDVQFGDFDWLVIVYSADKVCLFLCIIIYKKTIIRHLEMESGKKRKEERKRNSNATILFQLI